MTTIRCLAADDERLALRLLKRHIEKLPQLELVASCEDAFAVMEVLQKEQVDLMFLDIQMPELTGFEMLRSLRKPPLAIMITAFQDHALEGYELDVVDYLIKPISFERFAQAVQKAQERLRKAAPVESEKDHFFVRSDYKLIKVPYDEIRYIEGLAQYVKIHTSGKTHVVHKTLKDMQSILPVSRFFRVHRSYIISLQRITAVFGNTVEIEEKQIPIGKSYREAFYKRIETL
jgi:DNA-binding LytR/AlgR family response regulator